MTSPPCVLVVAHPGGVLRGPRLEAVEASSREATHVALELHDRLRRALDEGERRHRDDLANLEDAARAQVSELERRVRALEDRAGHTQRAREELQAGLAEAQARCKRAQATAAALKRDLESAEKARAGLERERERLVAHVRELLTEKRQVKGELRASRRRPRPD